MNKKSEYIFSIAANLAAWIIMTLADYYQESFGDERLFGILYLPPIIILISYTIILGISKEEFSWSNQFHFMGTYFIIGLPIASAIIYMVDKNIWIVKQIPTHEFLDFNGIEYLFFGIILIAGCEIGFFILSLFKRIFGSS